MKHKPINGKAINWEQRFADLHMQAQDERLRNYYAEGIAAQDSLLAHTPFVALDLETTGLDAQQDDIVSVGLVPFTTQRIMLREAQEWLVKPQQTLADESVIIHGITHNELQSAPDFEQILYPLLRALAGRVVVVHHRAIERSFIHQALLSRLNESLEFPLIDTLELEQQALRLRQGLLGRLLKRPTESVRLADCRRRYSLPYYQAHHALTDAIATAELFQAQVAYHYREDTRVGDVWC